MTDRMKSAVVGDKTSKMKRQSSVSFPSASRLKSISKDNKPVASKSKKIDHDTTILKQEPILPDFDNEQRQIAYSRFMRAMLEECLIEEKIEREETQIDLQMTQLAERFQKTMDQLDKTNRRLKDISFMFEQKRLLDLKSNDCVQLYKMTEESNAKHLLEDLSNTEKRCLDKIELHNVDFGYDKNSGHKQLLDAVNDAIDGLKKIKNESNLDAKKFMEYDCSKHNIEELEKDRFDLESLKLEFEAKFPKLSEQLVREASEKIARMIENDDDDDNDDV